MSAIVLGAGIAGLTTAVRLLEAGYAVHIVAAHLPDDPLDAHYASTIAGAHHLSFADDADARQRKWDMRTFRVLYDEWKRDGEASGLMALTQTELWVGSTRHLEIYEEHPDFRVLDPATAPCACDHMVSFTSLTIAPTLYLSRLLVRIRALGGRIHRMRVASMESLLSPGMLALFSDSSNPANNPTTITPSPTPTPAPTPTPTPAALFICPGLGAASLPGLTDPSVYPTRGQVLAVRAPWVRSGWTRQVGSLAGGEGGSRTYVIPRCTGEVILGGTREEGDWDPRARAETRRDILQRAVGLCPEIVPVHLRGKGGKAEGVEGKGDKEGEKGERLEKLLEPIIIGDRVGFRPSRVGGTRVEREDRTLAGHRVPVIYNYGHGGAGWQSCWGCAEDAVALLAGRAKL